MHERVIAQELLASALVCGTTNHAQQIKQFRIELCETSHESEPSLRMYLEHLVRGTIAENAEFEFLHVPAPARCKDCDKEFEQHELAQPCPRCGSSRVITRHVEPVRLTSIEID